MPCVAGSGHRTAADRLGHRNFRPIRQGAAAGVAVSDSICAEDQLRLLAEGGSHLSAQSGQYLLATSGQASTPAMFPGCLAHPFLTIAHCSQTAITRDNVSVSIDGVLFVKVHC